MTPPQTDSGASSPTGGGSAAKAKADRISNLLRTRENQRRSRARRREYIADLEAKYRKYEAMGAEASVEIQMAARKVIDENRRLRKIIEDFGLPIDDNDDKPVDKLESLLNKKRKVSEDVDDSILMSDLEDLEPATHFAETTDEQPAQSKRPINSHRSVAVGRAPDQMQKQQLSVITPKVEPISENSQLDRWNQRSSSVTDTPARQMPIRQDSWSATPSTVDHTIQRREDWVSNVTDMHQDAEALAAAAGLSVRDPAMGYLLADPNTLLEQMYGIPAGGFVADQSSYNSYQSNAAQMSSHSDVEFYWGPAQQQAVRQAQSISLQQQGQMQSGPPQQHPQLPTPQEHSHRSTPLTGTPRPQHQPMHPSQSTYQQGQVYQTPPGFQYPRR